MKLYYTTLGLTFLALVTCLQAVEESEDLDNTTEKPVYELEPFQVIGSKEDIFELQGSGYFLTTDEIRSQNYTNVNRVLGRVPGVYVRDEDGYGNFPNISIRGGDGTRASKVTIMEDGILTSPAPYSAPAAYYSPQIGRMSGLEILKGSSQIEYGPNTTGGVINYLSTPVPLDETFYSRNTYGTDDTFLSHTYYGNTVESNGHTFGYLFELYHNQSDGFRKIQPGTGYSGSDDTGYKVTEPMLKIFWEPNTDLKQRLEFKFGSTDFEADESYTGLSEDDVRSNEDTRYAATRFDNIDTEQYRTYLKYQIEPKDDLRFELAAYYNRFERDWFKLDDVAVGATDSVREALTTDEGLALLRGTGPGELFIRHNAREYEAYGAQFTGEYGFETGDFGHLVKFGIRYHNDDIDRDQYDEVFEQNASGQIIDQRFRLNNVRYQETDSVALWLKDEISFDRLTVTPGIRYEHIRVNFDDYTEDTSQVATRAELEDLRNAIILTESNTDSYDEIVPGVSFNYEIDNSKTVFGGVHKGISIPGPRAVARVNPDARSEVEESLGLELGTRHRSRAFAAEAVWFHTKFDNLIGTDAGFGNSDVSNNAGEATVWGFEGFFTYDPLYERTDSLPVYFSITWTSAEFDEGVAAGGEADIFNGGEAGNELPYTPEWKLAWGIGYTHDKWSVSVDTTYTSDAFATGDNDSLDPIAENNARLGKIDSLLITDLSGTYQLTQNVNLLAGINNVFDERGIVSRVPRGPRANIGRTAYFGAEVQF
ncbi:MAG: Fe(3+) dicitrate transport protein [Zhongshania aliphaticivorans]|jgi:Fe(3+) dicitrate transport protein